MAYTYHDHVNSGTIGDPYPANTTLTVTSGDIIVAIARTTGTVSLPASVLSDSQGNTYSPACDVAQGLGMSMRIFATKATATGTVVVQLTSPGGSYLLLETFSLTGGHATTYIDNATGLVVPGGVSGSLTTTVANAAIVAAAQSGSGYPTAGSGYTLQQQYSFSLYAASEYKLDAGSAAAKTVDFSGDGLMCAAAFRPATGGGSTPTLTSIAPSDGFIGATGGTSVQNVTFTGTNLSGATPSINGLSSGVTASNIVQVSSVSMTASLTMTSAVTPAALSLSITTADGTSGTQTFTARSRTSVGTGGVGRSRTIWN
jgi:hypothetical protein